MSQAVYIIGTCITVALPFLIAGYLSNCFPSDDPPPPMPKGKIII